jgi:acetyltransferase-like isoleucine patch superfamily enzyme
VHEGDRTRLTAGRSARFDRDVEVLIGGNHRFDWVTIFALREQYRLPGAYRNGNPWSRGDIVVEGGARIGAGARILSGVRIGHGATVGPYAVVTRDVGAGEFVCGHPAAERPARLVSEPPRRPSPSLTMSTDSHPTGPASGSWKRRIAGRARRAGDGVRRGVALRLHHLADSLDGSVEEYPFDHVPAEGEPAPTVVMGRASYFEPTVIRPPGRAVTVTIGNYTSVAANCECVFDFPFAARSADHVANRPGAEPVDVPADEIIIGSDAWVTRGTKVMAGVRIGDGAVVGAYSVVYDDVRPFAIVAGNPAVEVGRRFDDETVDALLAIRWWDWPEEEVLRHWEQLCSTNVADFVRRFQP